MTETNRGAGWNSDSADGPPLYSLSSKNISMANCNSRGQTAKWSLFHRKKSSPPVTAPLMISDNNGATCEGQTGPAQLNITKVYYGTYFQRCPTANKVLCCGVMRFEWNEWCSISLKNKPKRWSAIHWTVYFSIQDSWHAVVRKKLLAMLVVAYAT